MSEAVHAALAAVVHWFLAQHAAPPAAQGWASGTQVSQVQVPGVAQLVVEPLAGSLQWSVVQQVSVIPS